MKAMLLTNPAPIERQPLALSAVPCPQPGPNEVLVRVDVCGVCRTDLHQVEGDLAMRKSPVVPGHQVVGAVAAVGCGATRFAEGDRVGIAWLHETCGKCPFCESDRENLCDAAKFTGWTVNGGYAEYATVPEAFAYAVPEEFPGEQAAPLLCAGVIGYRSLRLSGVQPGQRLGLYGFGASAHIVIQVARHWDCETYVITRSESNRALARRLGAAWCGGPQDVPPAKLHAAIIFAPAGPLVLDALAALEKGGTVALAGIHMSEIPAMDYAEHLYHEKVLRSAANATRRDATELLQLAAEIPIRTNVTTYPLEQANQALLAVKNSAISGAAVLKV